MIDLTFLRDVHVNDESLAKMPIRDHPLQAYHHVGGLIHSMVMFLHPSLCISSATPVKRSMQETYHRISGHKRRRDLCRPSRCRTLRCRNVPGATGARNRLLAQKMGSEAHSEVAAGFLQQEQAPSDFSSSVCPRCFRSEEQGGVKVQRLPSSSVQGSSCGSPQALRKGKSTDFACFLMPSPCRLNAALNEEGIVFSASLLNAA